VTPVSPTVLELRTRTVQGTSRITDRNRHSNHEPALNIAPPLTCRAGATEEAWRSEAPGAVLAIDPASGTDAEGTLTTTKYNDFADLRWLGAAGKTTISSGDELGQWYFAEAHVRLHDIGLSNGTFRIGAMAPWTPRGWG
jgi:hypothetical protein